MRASLWIVALAACHGRAAAPAVVDNRGPTGSLAPGCPDAAPPFAAEPAPHDPACLHGLPAPWLSGECHRFLPIDDTTAFERVVVDDRVLWLRQFGCVHATFEVVGTPRGPLDRGDRAALLRAGADLLDELDRAAPEVDLAVDVGWLREAAAATPPPDHSFPLGPGDQFATVSAVDGADTISVLIDFPM